MAQENSIYETEYPERPQYAKLDDDLDIDIAIVGGGLTGISAALHLVENGFDVAVLEDGCGAFSEKAHNAALDDMASIALRTDIAAPKR